MTKEEIRRAIIRQNVEMAFSKLNQSFLKYQCMHPKQCKIVDKLFQFNSEYFFKKLMLLSFSVLMLGIIKIILVDCYRNYGTKFLKINKQ